MTSELLRPALEALDDCGATLRELEAACCEPSRSPRMKTLAGTLAEAEAVCRRASRDPQAGATTLARLEAAREQVRSLQVDCCAPERMPFYVMLLEELSSATSTLRAVLDG